MPMQSQPECYRNIYPGPLQMTTHRRWKSSITVNLNEVKNLAVMWNKRFFRHCVSQNDREVNEIPGQARNDRRRTSYWTLIQDISYIFVFRIYPGMTLINIPILGRVAHTGLQPQIKDGKNVNRKQCSPLPCEEECPCERFIAIFLMKKRLLTTGLTVSQKYCRCA